MKMGIELLVPGVQRDDKTQFAAEGVFTEGQQRPGGGLEKDRQHHPFVVQHNGIERMGQGKDHMKVADR